MSLLSVIIWTVYAVLLLLAMIYAGIIVYHVLKYRDDDLPREQFQHSNKALAIYLGLSGLVVLLSLIITISMLLL